MHTYADMRWIPDGRDANLESALALQPAAMASDMTGEPVDGSEQEGERPFWVKSFDVLAVGMLLALLALALGRLASALLVGGPAWLLLPAAIAALLCADLVSGVVHWIGDRFFLETTPVLGRMLIRPFREHHRDPLAITRHGFFELCGNNALAVVAPVLALLVFGPHPASGTAAFAGNAFMAFFAVAVFATNLFHKWAHLGRVAAPVRWLQRARVILPPAAHDRHHRGDFSRAYCVTTGWINPLADALRLLPRSEAWLRALGRGAGAARRSLSSACSPVSVPRRRGRSTRLRPHRSRG
jgi:hypothetical protein